MICDSVILAAGLGTRMKSDLAKVLHPIGGRPMLAWVVQACREATGRVPHVVIGPEAEQARTASLGEVQFAEQIDRLGTGHAVLQVRDRLEGRSDFVLVVYGDMPLMRPETLRSLMETQSKHEGPFTLLTVKAGSSRGFGRIARDGQGNIAAIVEEAHASPEELAIGEYNVGAYCFRAGWLWEHIGQLALSPKGEYYLTDLVSMAVDEGLRVASVEVKDEDEVIGINTREHLALAETAFRWRVARAWMEAGVTLVDPATSYIGPDAKLGPDTIILPNTHLEGATVVGSWCRLGPNTVVRDSSIGDRCTVAFSVVEGATLDEDVTVGPFAHLRSGAHLMRGVHMGNFGEVKSSTLGPGTKMGHFSYVGDATVGDEANIGAGTVTCNFDGERKQHTDIGEGAFIGSDTMLVAPVRVGKGARTGAGSVVTKDVPDDTLAVGAPARAIRKLKRGG